MPGRDAFSCCQSASSSATSGWRIAAQCSSATSTRVRAKPGRSQSRAISRMPASPGSRVLLIASSSRLLASTSSAALPLKWPYTAGVDTSARRAMSASVAPSYPHSTHASTAARSNRSRVGMPSASTFGGRPMRPGERSCSVMSSPDPSDRRPVAVAWPSTVATSGETPSRCCLALRGSPTSRPHTILNGSGRDSRDQIRREMQAPASGGLAGLAAAQRSERRRSS